jgi:hypothetical protein
MCTATSKPALNPSNPDAVRRDPLLQCDFINPIPTIAHAICGFPVAIGRKFYSGPTFNDVLFFSGPRDIRSTNQRGAFFES